MNRLSASNVSLIAYDFDGVMTNNQVLVSQDGIESVLCNRGDGLGIDRIRALGIEQMIISTEPNPIVKARALKLKLDVIYNCENKLKAITEICSTRNIDRENVVFVGNDLNDYEAMSFVGIPVCPNDAYPTIKEIAKLVLSANGGDGVIRELSDYFYND